MTLKADKATIFIGLQTAVHTADFHFLSFLNAASVIRSDLNRQPCVMFSVAFTALKNKCWKSSMVSLQG